MIQYMMIQHDDALLYMMIHYMMIQHDDTIHDDTTSLQALAPKPCTSRMPHRYSDNGSSTGCVRSRESRKFIGREYYRGC